MAAAAAAVAGSGGRAAVRGGAEARPGIDVAGAQRAVEGLSIGGGGRPTFQARRRGALLFIAEPHTRPSHITDKRGESVQTFSFCTSHFIKILHETYFLNIVLHLYCTKDLSNMHYAMT